MRTAGMSVAVAVGLALALGCSVDTVDGGLELSTGGAAPDREATGTEGDAIASDDETAARDPDLDPDPDEGDDAHFDVGHATGGDDVVTDACDAAERQASNLGCRFWAVDLPNSPTPAPGGTAQSQQFAVVVANGGASDATIAVYLGDGATPIAEANVAPLATHTFDLPEASIDPTTSTTDGVAFRIESDAPITAYQFNPLQNELVYSNDATVLWPEHVLTTDYTAVTENATSVAPAYVSIVAIEDDTLVQVFPTTTVQPAGITEATLARGEVFTVISALGGAGVPNGGNLSGTRIASDRPVAAFSGNVSAPVIPAGSAWVGGARICCADHLEHQLIPLQAWGSTYVVATPAPAYYPVDPARYRITAAYDDTVLSYAPAAPPGAPPILAAGQTAVFETDASFTVSSEDAMHPFSITQFLPSGDTTSSIFDAQRRGDPAMIMLPPRQQFTDEYVFAIPGAYAIHRLTIVAPAGTTVTLDEQAVDPAVFVPLATLDGTEWVYAHIDATEGTHVLTASDPVGLTVAGYDVEVSYGFTGGSTFEPISIPPPAG